MILNVEREFYRHQCLDRKREISMWKNTFFSRSKVPVNEAMNMIYLWLNGATHSTLLSVGGHSIQFITNLLHDLNQLLADNVEPTQVQIGGPGRNRRMQNVQAKIQRRASSGRGMGDWWS